MAQTANLARALQLLEQRRKSDHGVFDELLVTPRRLYTSIYEPASPASRNDVDGTQIRASVMIQRDFRVRVDARSSTPVRLDFEREGLRGHQIDASAPERALRSIDVIRHPGTAMEDLDYLVIRRVPGRDAVTLTLHLLQDTPAPRLFVKRLGQRLRIDS